MQISATEAVWKLRFSEKPLSLLTGHHDQNVKPSLEDLWEIVGGRWEGLKGSISRQPRGTSLSRRSRDFSISSRFALFDSQHASAGDRRLSVQGLACRGRACTQKKHCHRTVNLGIWSLHQDMTCLASGPWRQQSCANE